MAFWLVKSEPSVCSIESLKRDGATLWDGVRNYQARNLLREMRKMDTVLFYHSSEEPVGVAGLCEVSKEAVPDPTQFDSGSKYFDPKSTDESPRWWCPELRFLRIFQRFVPLSELRKEKSLSGMTLLQKGSRLSVHRVSEKDFTKIVSLGERS